MESQQINLSQKTLPGFIDQSATLSKVTNQQSIVRKIIQSKTWNKNLPFSLVYLISSFLFPNPLVIKPESHIYLGIEDRVLKEKKVIYCAWICKENTTIFNPHCDKKQESQRGKHCQEERNTIHKLKVIKIWKQCSDIDKLDELMRMGQYIMTFFASLRIGKSKKNHSGMLELEECTIRSREQEDGLFWGNKQQKVNLVVKNQALTTWSLKEIKSYSKTNIISQRVKKALIYLIQSNIIVIYMANTGQYWLYLSRPTSNLNQLIGVVPSRIFQHLSTVDLNQQASNDFRDAIRYIGRQWMISDRLQLWEKPAKNKIKSRGHCKIIDGSLREYSISDYFVEKI